VEKTSATTVWTIEEDANDCKTHWSDEEEMIATLPSGDEEETKKR
jgi:hypothetical protein